jgi:hypothetical protein
VSQGAYAIDVVPAAFVGNGDGGYCTSVEAEPSAVEAIHDNTTGANRAAEGKCRSRRNQHDTVSAPSRQKDGAASTRDGIRFASG